MAPPKKTPPKKSGDSARQDAEAAIEAQRLNPDTDGSLLAASLQGGVDEAKEAGADEGTVRRLTASMEALAGIVEKLQKSNSHLESELTSLRSRSITAAQKKGMSDNYIFCGVCRQVLFDSITQRGVCKGEHVALFVAPYDQDMWKDFYPGVVINGIVYYGTCLVPLSLVDSIKAVINRWSRGELQKHRSGGHVYGDTPGGVHMQRANLVQPN